MFKIEKPFSCKYFNNNSFDLEEKVFQKSKAVYLKIFKKKKKNSTWRKTQRINNA